MTGPELQISNSEIQTFKQCRRKWWLSYYRKLRPMGRDYTGPLALGSRVHAALETYYRDGVPLLTAWNDLCETDRLKMAAEMRDMRDLDSEAELGRIMLEGYLAWVAEEGIDSEYEFTSAEEILRAPLLDGQVELQGKIDQRVWRKRDGARFIRDFKTAANFADMSRTAHMNEQFMTYHLLEMLKSGEDKRVAGTIVTLIKKVKRSASAHPPFYDQLEIRHNIFTLRNFWSRLHGVLTDMLNVKRALDSGVDHRIVAYPKPSRDCTWMCPHYAICPLFDDGSAVEAAIEMHYETVDPYDYYNSEKTE